MTSAPGGIPFDFNWTLADTMEGHYLACKSVAFYPGVKFFVSELKDQKVPMAIITESHLDQLQQSVPKTFLAQFYAIATGNQVLKGKPYPDPFLKSTELFGMQPTGCIAIENAPVGVKSACATVSREVLGEANEILERFEDLRYSIKFQQFLGTKTTHA
jgi:beta-phosphoglucomutase-like phosphatase (HAD superfamily)